MEEQLNLLFQKITLKKCDQVRLIICNIQTTGIIMKKDHLIELAAIEIEDLKLTGKIFHMYIKPRVYVSQKYTKLNHIKYVDYFKYHDTKFQLENFLNFIGKDEIFFLDDINYEFLIQELKYWQVSYSSLKKNTLPSLFRILIEESKNLEIENFNNNLKFDEKINEIEDSFYEILENRNKEFDLSISMTSRLIIDILKITFCCKYMVDKDFRYMIDERLREKVELRGP